MYADPKLKDAFTKAIKHYFDDHGLEEMDKVSGERKFTKKYFDGLESDLTGEKDDILEKPKKRKPKLDSSKPKENKNKSNSLRLK